MGPSDADLQLRPYLPLHSPSIGMDVLAVLTINHLLASQLTEPVLMLVGHSAAKELRETRPSRRPKYTEGGGRLTPRKANYMCSPGEAKRGTRQNKQTHAQVQNVVERGETREPAPPPCSLQCLFPTVLVPYIASTRKDQRSQRNKREEGERKSLETVHIVHEHALDPAALSPSAVAHLRSAHLRYPHVLHLHWRLLWLQVLILGVARRERVLHLRL